MNRYHDLDKRIDLLEERMNTKQAEYETALEKLTGETRAALGRIEASNERFRADMAEWKTYTVRTIYSAAILAAALIGVIFSLITLY